MTERVLAVAYEASYLALVIISDGSLYDWQRYRIHPTQWSRIGPLVARFAADYCIAKVVIDPRHKVRFPRWLSHVRLKMSDAKHNLLGNSVKPTNRAAIGFLIDHAPSLRQLIDISPVTGKPSMTKPWQTVMLMAGVLATAYAQSEQAASTRTV